MSRERHGRRPIRIAKNSIDSSSWKSFSLMLAASKTSTLWSLNIAPKPIACISANSAPSIFSLKKPVSGGCQQPFDVSSGPLALQHSKNKAWKDRALSKANCGGSVACS